MSSSVFSRAGACWLGLSLGLHGLVACTGVTGDKGAAEDDAAEDDAGGEGGEGGRGDGGNGSGGQVGAGTESQPGAFTWRRLTSDQLNNTLEDLFGAGIAAGAPEPDIRDHNFFGVGAAKNATSSGGVEKIETLSHELAEKIAGDAARRERWFKCDPKTNFRSCVETSLKGLSRAMFRRPVPNESLTALTDLADRARADLGDPWKGVQFALAAMLQSPRFFYIQERAAKEVGTGKSVRLDGHSIASRLSFWLWNTTPDEALLAAADDGELDTDEGIERQVQRMWQSPRAKVGMREFFASAWGLHKAKTRAFDVNLFPNLAASVGPSALESALRSLELHILDGGKSVAEALLSNETFVNRDLAPIYGMQPLPGPAYAKVQLPESAQRHGFLTHAAFVMANSTPDDTQPMLRGKTIRENLLCQPVPEPPPGLMAQLPPLDPNVKKTKRERLAQHREDPFCAGCHDPIDPPGLALENYDAAGFFRDKELGLPIDASGELDGATFSGPKDITRVVVEHEAFPGCVVKNLYRHATAQLEEEEDPALAALANTFAREGSLSALVQALAHNEVFTHVTMPPL